MVKFLKLTFLLLLVPFLAYSQSLNKEQTGTQYIQENAEEWGLLASDVQEMLVTDSYVSKNNGVTHVFYNQTFNRIPVQGAVINLNITEDDRVFHHGNKFVNDIKSKVNHFTAAINERQAISAAFQHFDIKVEEELKVVERKTEKKAIYQKTKDVERDMWVELTYVLEEDKAYLVYEVQLRLQNTAQLWNVLIDAKSGKYLSKHDAAIKCSIGHTHSSSCVGHAKAPQKQILMSDGSGADGASYRVYPVPADSPLRGDHELLTDPCDPVASPFGWHDTDGVEGPEFTTTRGNNTFAYDDSNGSNSPTQGAPDGGDDLVFDFLHDTSSEPIFSSDASATQVFYMNNIMHDFSYRYGFDEAAGNFQANNYGNGGQGNDIVVAETLDGRLDENGEVTTNNAVFMPSPDGSPGGMEMYLWNKTSGLMTVNEPAELAGIKDVGAYGDGEFGIQQADYDIEGDVVLAFTAAPGMESLGCTTIVNTDDVAGNIAFVDRGECFFSEKAFFAQEAGAIGVIICNFEDQILNMAGGGLEALDVTIPGIFMASTDCDLIRSSLDAGVNVNVAIKQSEITGPAQLDGGFDNGIVAHEYAHGISNRLVGGPSNISCLRNVDSSGDGAPDSGEQMGEGWSDYFTLITTVSQGDTGAEAKGIGNYANSEDENGRGIRRFPYSTDMDVCPLTYDDIKTGSVPHGVGEVWCAVLWDLYWAMVDIYGYDDDINNAESGNAIGVQLAMDGMKMTPCRPTFLEARDAILAADEINNGGANSCAIWSVFARRGMGFFADAGDEDSSLDGSEDFEPLPTCIEELKITKSATPRILPGEDIDVVINIVNHKTEAVTGVVVTDNLPAGLSLVQGSESFAATEEGGMLVFDIGDMAILDEMEITYKLASDPDNTSATNVFDDMEVISADWDIVAIDGFDIWTITDLEAFSGSLSWFAPEVAITDLDSDQVLEYKELNVVGENPVLRFFHNYNTELGSDAGFIEVSNDGGQIWNRVEEEFLLGAYNGVVQYGTFAIPNLLTYSGNSGGWVPAYISLADFAGETIAIRFRFGCDDNTLSEDTNVFPGWYIDDFELIDLKSYVAGACITSEEGDNICAPLNETLIDPTGTISSTDDKELTGYSMELTPNPAQDFVTVGINSDLRGPVAVSISTGEGKMISNQKVEITNDKTYINFDTNNLVSGFYFVILEAGNKILTKKLLVH